jgi:hypothetical protein
MRKQTSAALAAGTSTMISWLVKRTTSFVGGAHLPNSSTLAPPSVTPAVASMAGPASRNMDAAVNFRPRLIATRSSPVTFWLIRQTRNVSSRARTANALRPRWQRSRSNVATDITKYDRNPVGGFFLCRRGLDQMTIGYLLQLAATVILHSHDLSLAQP